VAKDAAVSRRFGTDGIRDLAGRGALAPAEVLALGRVLGSRARAGRCGAREGASVLIGRDTRASGPAIEALLAKGLAEQGVEVVLAGVIPTPGVSWLVRRRGFALGIVVSASHNPAEYNGIKVFDAEGFKLSLAQEMDLERRLDRGAPLRPVAHGAPVHPVPDLLPAYEAFLKSQLTRQALAGHRIVADTAQGATAGIFQRCLAHWGAKAGSLGDAPDGANINRGVGATAPQALAAEVRRMRAQAGVAFDGDGDRVVFVDERGEVLDGDALLYVIAKDLHARRRWPHRTVVATEISNLGLDRAIAALGGRVVRTPVGDRHVSARMREGGFVLGGESSGHLILPGSGGTGDGMLAAARVLGILKRTGKPLSRLAAGLVRFPQISRNVRVSRKPSLRSLPVLASAMASGEKVLGREGRLMVRYSGTEPLLRILAEGPDRRLLEDVTAAVADAAKGLA
jgi:phosphoglucosamine mutase